MPLWARFFPMFFPIPTIKKLHVALKIKKKNDGKQVQELFPLLNYFCHNLFDAGVDCCLRLLAERDRPAGAHRLQCCSSGSSKTVVSFFSYFSSHHIRLNTNATIILFRTSKWMLLPSILFISSLPTLTYYLLPVASLSFKCQSGNF